MFLSFIVAGFLFCLFDFVSVAGADVAGRFLYGVSDVALSLLLLPALMLPADFYMGVFFSIM